MNATLSARIADPAALTDDERTRIASARADAYASNTRMAYTSRVRLYAEWLRSTGRTQDMAFEPLVVLVHITAVAEHSGLSAVDQTYAAILRAAKDAGADVSRIKGDSALADALRGIRRKKTRESQTRKARAFEKDELRTLLRHLTDEQRHSTATALRDRVLLLAGTGLGIRGSELASLRFEDIIERSDMGGLEVRLKYSKTSDCEEVLTLARLAEVHREACPVRALESWREHVRVALGLDNDALAQTHILLHVRRGGHVTPRGVTGEAVTDALRRLCIRAGVDANVSSHGLRSTYATAALDAEIPWDAVMQGRWRSARTLANYDRRSRWQRVPGNTWQGGI